MIFGIQDLPRDVIQAFPRQPRHNLFEQFSIRDGSRSWNVFQEEIHAPGSFLIACSTVCVGGRVLAASILNLVLYRTAAWPLLVTLGIGGLLLLVSCPRYPHTAHPHTG